MEKEDLMKALKWLLSLQNDLINEGDNPVIKDIKNGLESGRMIMELNGKEITLLCEMSERQRSILYAGGLLNLTREESK